MTIESYGINGYWENYAQGLTEKQRENIIEEAVFFEFEQYRKGYNLHSAYQQQRTIRKPGADFSHRQKVYHFPGSRHRKEWAFPA